MLAIKQLMVPIDFHSISFPTMEDQQLFGSSKFNIRNLYRFETTWGWVNDDKISIFEWTIPLIVLWQFVTRACVRQLLWIVNMGRSWCHIIGRTPAAQNTYVVSLDIFCVLFCLSLCTCACILIHVCLLFFFRVWSWSVCLGHSCVSRGSDIDRHSCWRQLLFGTHLQ